MNDDLRRANATPPEAPSPPSSSGRRPPVVTRRRIGDAASVVETGEAGLPVVVRAKVPSLPLASWIQAEVARLDRLLLRFGAVLYRGFAVPDPVAFEAIIAALDPSLMVEHERSSPRSFVSGSIYTSTDHPADQEIFVHNEMSYSVSWPLRLGLHCVEPAEHGGATPLCSMRAVTAQLPPDMAARFRRVGVQYVRNYSGRFGLPWQTSFATDDPRVVTSWCTANGIVTEWHGDSLRTRRTGPAFVTHPVTGEDLWFNHATFFHISTLDPAIGSVLASDLAPDDLPTNSLYGDGTPIEPEVLDTLRRIHRSCTVTTPWQAGDVMIVDNMLVAHGREPFEGPRTVLVAMTSPFRSH